MAHTDHSDDATRWSDADFRAIFTAAGAGRSLVDARTGRFLRVNPTYCAITGYTEAQLLESTLRDLAHPDDAETDTDAFRRMARGELAAWTSEKRYLRPNGSVVWVQLHAGPVRDAEGHVVRMAVIVHDITARKQADEAFRTAAARDAFRLRLSDALRAIADPLDVQSRAMHLLAGHLRTDRAFYYEVVREDAGCLFIVECDEARSAGMVSLVGRYPRSAFGAATLVARLDRGEGVTVRDVRSHPAMDAEEVQRYVDLGIATCVVAPVMSRGRHVAGVCLHGATPRDWLPDEVALLRDVAEQTWETVARARAEDEVRHREAQLRLVLDAAEAGTWSWDPATNRIDADDRFRAMLDFGPDDDCTLERWLAAIHPDDRAVVEARLHQVERDPEDVLWDQVFRVVRRGEVAWLHEVGKARQDGEGRVVRMTGITLDVTDRRRVEAALAERREYERTRTLQLLLETATQGILSVAPDGTIVTANRALETMFGWGPGELPGQSLECLVPAPLARQHHQHRVGYFEAPRPRAMGQGLELVGARKDGTTFPIEVSLNHVPTAEGGLALAFVTDITERVRAATALRDSHHRLALRTEQLGRLAAELTLAEQRAREQLAKTLHDGLQQMLFSARLRIAGAMPARSDDSPRVSHALAQATADLDEAIAAARSLAVELFPPALHERGLPRALTWLAEWMGTKYGLAVRATVDAAADPQRPDVRVLLFESVRELLFNVVKHVGTQAEAAVDLATLDDAIHITVSDNGPGIDPEVAFGRSDRSRVGLGLFSIRERLSLMGGRLEIAESAAGDKGLRLVAPLDRPRAAHTGTASTPPVAVGDEVPRPVTVLIVDDHASVRAGLREMLSDEPGILVVGEAVDGFDAIALARALRPDAIVIDVSMPVMDGIEATRRIHAELPAIQIFGFSTQERMEDLHAIEEAGAAGYFTKDADAGRLVARLLAIRAG